MAWALVVNYLEEHQSQFGVLTIFANKFPPLIFSASAERVPLKVL